MIKMNKWTGVLVGCLFLFTVGCSVFGEEPFTGEWELDSKVRACPETIGFYKDNNLSIEKFTGTYEDLGDDKYKITLDGQSESPIVKLELKEENQLTMKYEEITCTYTKKDE